MRFGSGLGRPIATTGPIEKKDARLSFGGRLQGGARGRAYKTDWDLDRIIREGMDRVVWIFRSVDAVARNQAKLPIVVRDGHPDLGPPIEDHHLLPLLNYRPNPFEFAWSFRYRLSMVYLLNKMGVQIQIVRDPVGRPAQLFILPPGKTHPVPDPQKGKILAHWEVDLPGGQKATVKAEDVLWIRLPHPTDPYSGMTPWQAAGLAIDTDWMARLYNREFLKNDARPGGIVGVHGEVDDDVIEEVHARLDGGPGSAGRVVVLETDEGGLQYVDTAVTPRDAQYVEARKLTKEEILIAGGTPESILGNASGRTWDNAETEKFIFWDETMDAHVRALGSELDALDSEDGTFVRFDLSGVPILQKHKAAKDAFHLDEWKSGAITLNQYLQATGRETSTDPMADVNWLAMGLVAAIGAAGGNSTAMAGLTKGLPLPDVVKELLLGQGVPDDPLAGAGAPGRGSRPASTWIA